MSISAIYVHWPFCRSKCPYCGFLSKASSDVSAYACMEQFLLDDLHLSVVDLDISSINSVFFGGGTPSLMSVQAVDNILNWLQANYGFDANVEITLEANPATFDKDKLRELRQLGVNRLSLGVQSFVDRNLRFLGRIYDSVHAYSAADAVASVFENFSFDFMFGYDGQSSADIEQDLLAASKFGCKHISSYQLMIEDGTAFGKEYRSGRLSKVSPDDAMLLYRDVRRILNDLGVKQYEVSNYAVPGYESMHNLTYWRYDDYLGVGPGAHSRCTIAGTKYEMSKPAEIDKWDAGSWAIKKPLTVNERLSEKVLMGLRLVDGIQVDSLHEDSCCELANNVCDRADFLRSIGYVTSDVSKIALTDIGMENLDAVIEYILQDVA